MFSHREVFPRAGLAFILAGRALNLASSRPARLMLSALAVCVGSGAQISCSIFSCSRSCVAAWTGPIVCMIYSRIAPPAVSASTMSSGGRAWRDHLQRWSERLDRQSDNPGVDDDAERPTEIAKALEQSARLVQSLERVLAPVVALEQALTARAEESHAFLDACIGLLHDAAWLNG